MKGFLLALIIASLLICCNTSRNSLSQNLYNSTWELEYLSGPKIAFDQLFPDRKPQIVFNIGNGKVEGNAGCNGYAAPYDLDGANISFGEPDPTTMMYCGEGEKFFLNTMRKVNKYTIVQGKLNLMFDEIVMMSFIEIDQ